MEKENGMKTIIEWKVYVRSMPNAFVNACKQTQMFMDKIHFPFPFFLSVFFILYYAYFIMYI